MLLPDSEIFATLRTMNPWWGGAPMPHLPLWRRAAFSAIMLWLENPPAPRALLLSGARQTGKTTLFLQAIDALVRRDMPPANILYATFDNPILKLAGIEQVLRVWRENTAPGPQTEWLFLDEIQFIPDWQVWVKHQVDFQKHRRLALTGSATPLVAQGQESGVGRWHTIPLSTLSFFEFLRIRESEALDLPPVDSLADLFTWSPPELIRASLVAESSLPAEFHAYLLKGGFPQAALAPSVFWAQKLVREDIVDKVLKRDMTALFGVRRVLELEHLFIYLCLHDGGILDMAAATSNLGMKRPTVANFVELLAATHLIHKLRPFGYGKEVLRGRHKVYLADAAISPSVLSRGEAALTNQPLLGQMAETAVVKHLVLRLHNSNMAFSYWRGRGGHEVDLVASVDDQHRPVEVKYRENNTALLDLRGLTQFCGAKGVERGYVITKSPRDFGILRGESAGKPLEILKIPAPLACYWLGAMEASLRPISPL